MLIDVILGLVISILTGILGLFPEYQLPDSVRDLGSDLGGSVSGLNGVFPVVALGACVALVIAARLFIAAWAAIAWAYAKIPMKFT